MAVRSAGRRRVGARCSRWTPRSSGISRTVRLPPNVTHLKMRGEDAVGTVSRDRPVDLLACDANVSPRRRSGIVSAFVPALRRGATLVLTFKDATKGYAEWRRQMESATETLTAAGFETPRIFHLFSNCSREKTLVAKFIGRERRGTYPARGDPGGRTRRRRVRGRRRGTRTGRGSYSPGRSRSSPRCRGVCRGAHQGQGVRAAAERERPADARATA